MGLEANGEAELEVKVTLARVGPPKKDSYRTLYFTVNGKAQEVRRVVVEV